MVYNIPDLDAGKLYYVRVSAVSSVGASDSTLAVNNPMSPSQHPGAPADVEAKAVVGNGSALNTEIDVSGLSVALPYFQQSTAVERYSLINGPHSSCGEGQ